MDWKVASGLTYSGLDKNNKKKNIFVYIGFIQDTCFVESYRY